jgi:uncharacterized protein YcfJ
MFERMNTAKESSMKKAVLVSAMGMAAAAWAPMASAEEVGRVLSSTPVIQQVAVQRQVCNNAPAYVQPQSSGGGALLGAIVGGVLGNQIGHGTGRAVATGIGMVAGAGIGNSAEMSGNQPQYAQQCAPQTSYENRTVGYNVQYEYAGKTFNVQMPYDPGPTIRLQLTPVSGNNAAPAEAMPQSAASGAPVGVILADQSNAAYPAYPAYSTYPAYTAYPAYPAYPGYGYYNRPYLAPIGISLGIGYSGGHRHHHWR